MSIGLDGKDGHFTSRGDFMYDLMARCGVSGENARGMIEKMGLLAKALLEDMYVKGRGLSSKLFLQTIETVLRTLYKPDPECEDQGKGAMVAAISRTDAAAFRIFLTEEKADNSKTPAAATGSRKLSLWCFNPGMALRELAAANVRSFILASGTLSPMASFAHELQIPFKNQLENLHVIKPSQVMVTVLKTGPTDITLNSSFNQRSNVVYKSELGMAISRTARVVPDGLLVFFPSYALMEDCISHWKVSTVSGEKTSIWSLIIQSKLPFVEPKSKADLPKVMQAYAKVIDDKESSKGAVFFAVCRGKVSEGLDFADAKGRAVIITGIPFPPFKDPKVMLKKDYLTDVGRKTNTPGADSITLTGEEWYQQQASRAVNQAIGRVIRHRNDYGAILFFDERYAQQRQINQLSKWVRGHVRVCDSFSGMCSALTLFFQNQAALSNRLVKNGSNSLPLTSSTKTDDSLQNALNLKQSLQKAKNFFTASQSVPIRLAADSLDSLPEGPSIPMNMIGMFAPKESLKIDIPVKETPPIPPTTHTETSHADLELAKTYMAKVRTTLSEEAASRFNLLLKGYRAKKIDVVSLTESLLKLYDSQGCLDLIDDFKSFVSQKNRAIFDEKVEAFRETKRRSATSVITTSASKAEAKSSTEGIGPRPHVKIEPIVQKILKSKKVCLGSSQTCPICRDTVDKPFEAKCGHICCFQCWTSWLNNTLECPLCRQRTRLSQLKKIYQ
jgi:regulator of telomere elongation helicase 1